MGLVLPIVKGLNASSFGLLLFNSNIEFRYAKGIVVYSDFLFGWLIGIEKLGRSSLTLSAASYLSVKILLSKGRFSASIRQLSLIY